MKPAAFNVAANPPEAPPSDEPVSWRVAWAVWLLGAAVSAIGLSGMVLGAAELFHHLARLRG